MNGVIKLEFGGSTKAPVFAHGGHLPDRLEKLAEKGVMVIDTLVAWNEVRSLANCADADGGHHW